MATYKSFEELPVCKQARVQFQALFPLLKAPLLATDAALRDQINRSSASVMDNIAEGFDRFSRADFRHFLIMARGSNAELRSQLYRRPDRGYVSETELKYYLQHSNQPGAGPTRFIHSLGQSSFPHKPKGKQPYLSEPPPPEDADFFPEKEDNS